MQPIVVQNNRSNEEATIDGFVPTGTAVDIERSLQKSGYAELQDVRCVLESGRVTLQGMVSSFFMKQVAQSIARRISGVRTVKNEIAVSK